MSNNCLQTKLKSVVNNNSLFKLGVMKITIPNETPTSMSLSKISSDENSVLHVASGTVYSNSSYTDVATDDRNISTTPSTTKAFTNAQGGAVVLEISNRYKLATLNVTLGRCIIKFSDFFGLQNLYGLINFQLIISDGRLEDLISTNYREVISDTKIVKFKLSKAYNSNVTFNGDFFSVTIDLSDSSLIKCYRGEIDSFVDATLLGTFNRSTGEWTYSS